MRKASIILRRTFALGALASLIAIASGCGTNDKAFSPGSPDTGTADFSSFVAIGNSLTAGYQSAALSSNTNAFSFPKLIADQAGVATFVQPDIEHPGIGQYAPLGAGILVLDLATLANPLGPDINPAPLTKAPSAMLVNATYAAPFNNLGIPSLLAVQSPSTAVDPAVPNAQNPFVDLILRNPALGATQLAQALALQPTFATVWLGNNDVLGYATTGGTLQLPGLPAAMPMPAANVKTAIEAVVGALDAQGCKVAIANIPNITAVPFFTTLSSRSPFTGDFLFGDEGGSVRALTSGDMVLLTAKDEVFGRRAGESGVYPVADSLVLSVAEQTAVNGAVSEYNDAIKQVADTYGCTLVDMNAFFDSIASDGYWAGGVHLNAGFIMGGLMSLDGIHPNSVGYTLVANEFIRGINTDFGANIPLASIADALNH